MLCSTLIRGDLFFFCFSFILTRQFFYQWNNLYMLSHFAEQDDFAKLTWNELWNNWSPNIAKWKYWGDFVFLLQRQWFLGIIFFFLFLLMDFPMRKKNTFSFWTSELSVSYTESRLNRSLSSLNVLIDFLLLLVLIKTWKKIQSENGFLLSFFQRLCCLFCIENNYSYFNSFVFFFCYLFRFIHERLVFLSSDLILAAGWLNF